MNAFCIYIRTKHNFFFLSRDKYTQMYMYMYMYTSAKPVYIRILMCKETIFFSRDLKSVPPVLCIYITSNDYLFYAAYVLMNVARMLAASCGRVGKCFDSLW